MRRFAFAPIALLCACFTAELDPDAAGVFACDDDDPCPNDEFCVNRRCEVDDPPKVEITFPELNSSPTFDDAPAGMLAISIGITGTLDLIDPDEHRPNEFGEGYLEVLVENVVVGTIEAGALSGGVFFEIQVPDVEGPVRVSARALRNNGSRYDNPEAVSRVLFWIDAGNPLVGVLNPWPGASFGLGSQTVQVEALVKNFSLMPAVMNGMTQDGVGHVHIYYDVDLTTCLVPMSNCDNSYKTTITGNKPSPAIFPDSAAGTAKISAVLRNIDHSLFLPNGPMSEISDEVEIIRE